ncbi:amidohydrolase [Propionigenium maris DSM 9537]|uniref:Amidohydrolase n=1 Tax=Propionigenium maris DSM 9537 TaxID=1123000 RepID=A0A9W6GHX9_9FUSO|nr:amidohydrolase [Propionigenium maris]GLI54490.1 amidohydrolase [Propionigenium maris DSM 9537]
MIKVSELSFLEEEVVDNYKFLHTIPELGFQEYKTAEFIEKQLKSYGVDELHTGVNNTTGIICSITGATPGKTVLLRADMDALPLRESTDVDFRSQRDGFMHACGHDGHVAMLLGAVKFLAENREIIKGRVKFVFQPAEEGPHPGGAHFMAESGLLDDVDAAFGLHLNTCSPTGSVGIPRRECTASTDSFSMKVIGKGGHGAAPYLAVDPIVLTSNIISSYQSIISREIDPRSTAVLSFGTIQGGDGASNIIPNEVFLNGTLRTFDDEVKRFIVKRMEEVAQSLASAHRGRVEFKVIEGYFPTINDERMALLVRDALLPLLGEENVDLADLANTGGEDFGRYLQDSPGAFYWLGCRNEEKGCTYMMHNPNMKIDLDALILGTQCHVNVALKFLMEE